MPRPTSPPSSAFDWALVDSSFDGGTTAHPLQQVLDLVQSDWTNPLQLEVDTPAVRRLFAQHRITTLVPTRNVVADQREEHRSRLATIYGVQMRIEAVAHQVLELLGDAAIDSRLLKGLASGELDYPGRHFRQTGDVDLAVRFDQFDDVVALLKSHGFSRHQTPNSPFLMKGTTLDAANGIEIDIHTRLFQRSPSTLDVFGQPGAPLTRFRSSALTLEQRLVHAAGHFILTPPGARRMSGLIDVTQLRNQPQVDLGKARRFAIEAKVEPLVGAALHLEARLARRPGAVIELADWSEPDWLDRSTRLSPHRRLVLDHFSRFREVPRDQWLAYLPTWLVPDHRQRALLSHSIERKTASITAAARDRLGRHK